MEGQQDARPPPGTTEWNHSYYTGNSLSAPHFVQQLQNGVISTSVQPLAYTLETNGTASPGFVSSQQLQRSAISSQVLAGPTRNVTSEVMPLAEAVTQFLFFEFLQRCGLLIDPPQLHQIPVPISTLDAAMQTTSRSAASQDVSAQTCARPVSSLSLDAAVQTPSHSVLISPLDAAVQTLPHSNASQDVSTQMGARPAFSFSFDAAVQTHLHSALSHDTSTQLPLPPQPSDTVTCTPRLHMCYCSHHRVSKSMPRLQVSRSLPTWALHMVYLIKRLLFNLPPQPPVSTTHVGNTSCALSYYRQEKC